MQRLHSFFVPDKARLIVDLETLFEYLHLVIHEYRECLHCGTERGSVHAVQQHMMDRGHCRFDISDESSEFRDFYDFTESQSQSPLDPEDSSSGQLRTTVYTEDGAMRLPSGRIISNRSAPQARPHRRPLRSQSPDTLLPLEYDLSDSKPQTEPASDSENAPGSALSKREEKKRAAFASHLASLSAGDRMSLMHLPASQQRAIVSTQLRQLDRAKKAERKKNARVEGPGMRTASKLFKGYDDQVPVYMAG